MLGPSLVGVSSSTSEAVPWKVTPGSECVVLPDTPTCLLPSPVGVLHIQLTVKVVRLACEESLVNHDCGLIHYQLLDRKPHTSLHEPPGRCVHVSACVWACVVDGIMNVVSLGLFPMISMLQIYYLARGRQFV